MMHVVGYVCAIDAILFMFDCQIGVHILDIIDFFCFCFLVDFDASDYHPIYHQLFLIWPISTIILA